jgi:hypothetical protein
MELLNLICFSLFFLDCRIENVYTTTFFIDSVNIAHK